jgi:serine/threonine protein kinase
MDGCLLAKGPQRLHSDKLVGAHKRGSSPMPDFTKVPDPSVPSAGQQTIADPRAGVDGAIGQIFGGKYRILSELSRGGMGRIYRAEQLTLGREVAIKVIMASDDPVANQRFLLEASLTAKLDHPNIVQIFDFGRTDDGTLFLVMELLNGKNLEDWVKSEGALSVADALQVAQQLCGALCEAHKQKVVHRDLKPSNIIVSRRAGMGITAKLIDFGLVKNANQSHGNTATGTLLGTPMYMAPEQILASGVDDRVDIYALGLTLYFALTGEQPYPELGLSALMHAQLNTGLQSISEKNQAISPEHLLGWIVETAVAKEPSQRFQNSLQFLEAARLCTEHLDSGGFPNLQITEGVLSSSDVMLNPTPSAPFVDPESYVKDGSAISKGFAQTLHGNVSLPVNVASLPGLGATSLSSISTARPTVADVPASRRWMPAVLVLLLAAAGAVFVLRPQSLPTPSTVQSAERIAVALKSAPEGADVYREGKLIGSTPFSVRLEAGSSVSLQLKLKGYESRALELSTEVPSVLIRMNPLTVDVAVPAEASAPIEVLAPKVERKPVQRKARKERKTLKNKPVDPWE